MIHCTSTSSRIHGYIVAKSCENGKALVVRSDAAFLNSCSFLFKRFAPGAEVFSVVFLLRNSLLTMCPLITTKSGRLVSMSIILYATWPTTNRCARLMDVQNFGDRMHSWSCTDAPSHTHLFKSNLLRIESSLTHLLGGSSLGEIDVCGHCPRPASLWWPSTNHGAS